MSKTTAWADLVKMEAVPVVETDELLKLAKSRLEGQACIYCCRKFMAGSEMALPCGLRLEALLFPNPGACCLLPAAFGRTGHGDVSDGSSSLGTFMLFDFRFSYFIHTQSNPSFFRGAIELFDLIRSD